jgi:putative PEP-CTERM system TPR-repeat lipoprotein
MNRTINKITMAMLLSLSISACSPNSTLEEQIEEAKAYLQQGKPNSAAILLKKVIVKSPKSALPRFLLGRSYLQGGNVISAEKELLRSLELGSDINLALPLIVKSLLAQQKYEDIILLSTEWYMLDKQVQGIVWAYEVIALIGQGDLPEAKTKLDQVTSVLPDQSIAKISNAYYQAAIKNIPKALSIVNDVLLEQPNFLEALELKGNISLFTKDSDGAINSYKNYLEQVPSNYQVQIKLSKALIQNSQFIEAEKIANNLLKVAPESAILHQIKGLVLYVKDDMSGAKYHIEKAMQNGLRTPTNKLIAGVIYFKEKNFEQAYTNLDSIRDTLASDHPSKKMLAITELELGYNTDAGQTFSELDVLTAEDEKLLTEASLVLSRRGDRGAVNKVVSQLKSGEMQDPESILKLGAIKLYLNEVEGLLDIEKAVDSMPESLSPKVVLFTAYIESGEFNKALAMTETLKKDKKNELVGFNLAGLLHIKKNELDKAKDNYTSALNIDENNINSLVFFANQAWQQQDLNLAKGYVDRILQFRPTHIPALKMNLSIGIKNNEEEAALTKIEYAYKKQPEMTYRLLLAASLFKLQKFEKIPPLLNQTDVPLDINTDNQVWVYLIRSFQLIGKVQKAADIANRWTFVKPNDELSWLYAIDLLDNQQQLKEALDKTELALIKHPQSPRLSVLYSYLLLHDKKIEKAKSNFNHLNEEIQSTALGLYVKGNLLAVEGNYQKALTILTASYQASYRATTAHLVFFILHKLKQSTKAHEFLEKHLQRFPKDVKTRIILADNYMKASPDKAINHYLYLADNNVASAIVLNNLAWLQLGTQEYDKAKINIEKAVVLSANNVNILDTAADISIKLNDKIAAKKYLEKALSFEPSNVKLIEKVNKLSN